MKRAFSTLEMLIAITVLVLVFSAVMLMVFGNQTLLVDSETNAEATAKAQAALENAQALARTDFHLVVGTSTVDDIYNVETSVTTLSDYFTKEVKATVSWMAEFGRAQSVTLTGLVTNFEQGIGGDTCSSELTGDWKNPDFDEKDFSVIANDSGDTYPITDLDAYSGRLYTTVNNTNANTNETFFIFSLSDPDDPLLLGKIDTSSVSKGLNAVQIATSSSGHYAYVGNAYDADFSTCTPSATCAQIQVLDISNSASPSVVNNFLIPTSTPPMVLGNVTSNAEQAVAKSLFYRNGYLYVGLSKTYSGPEFHVIDVHNPLSPRWVGSWPTSGVTSNAAVNAISVRGNYAYLATEDNEEIVVLDVSNPSNPVKVGGYDASGASGNGKSITVIGDRAYLGRTVGLDEFHMVSVSDPANPAFYDSFNIDASVNGLLVRNNLAFLGTTDGDFHILDVGSPTSITEYIPPEQIAGGDRIEALECEGNYLYTGSVGASGDGTLTIITAN